MVKVVYRLIMHTNVNISSVSTQFAITIGFTLTTKALVCRVINTIYWLAHPDQVPS